VLINVKKWELWLRMNEEEVIFNVFKAIKQPDMGEYGGELLQHSSGGLLN
jgi:hypothetical protein